MANSLAESDRALLQRAVDSVEKSEAVLRFVQAHIASVYGLKSGDGVDHRSGVIARSTVTSVSDVQAKDA